jgi:hypothetical protein
MTGIEKPRTWTDILGHVHPEWPGSSALAKSRIRNVAYAHGYEITPHGVVIEKIEPLYSGHSGPRCAARDQALYLAQTRGIPPYSRSEKYGLMYATDVDSDGLVTYRAASSF